MPGRRPNATIHAGLRRATSAVLVATTIAMAGCGGTGGEDAPATAPTAGGGSEGPGEVRLVEVGRFDEPLRAAPVPGTSLVAVVEKGGRVLVVDGMLCSSADRCPRRPVTDGDVVLDLGGSVSTGSEQGLLGLAFHPDWPDDPRVFINYTDLEGDTRVEAWTLDTPTGRARRQRELLRIEQPFANHNGGHLAFGPDGLLYIGTGDGGSGGDPADRAQKPDELLGKLLRLDVDGGGERGFAIPDGNVRRGAPEVWAIGLRNPWRFSFDSTRGDLWIGDVGQNEREEIDAVEHGQLDADETLNFEWRRREGFAPFDDSGTNGPGRDVPPVLDYGRDEGCSVTGGVVYRGKLVPKLRGWYLFADFCADDLRLLDADGVPGSTRRRGELTWVRASGTEQVASIDEVQGGEVLLVSLAGGIHQVVEAG